jgi:hypothetical protein
MKNINSLNSQNIESIFSQFTSNEANTSSSNNNLPSEFASFLGNGNDDLLQNIMSFLTGQMVDSNDNKRVDPKVEQGFSGLQAKRQKGEKGDLFDKVTIDGKEKLLALRENGRTEVSDVEKYGVKTADEAINVEKGIKETEGKFQKLAEKRVNGEKGDLYDSVEVNGKNKLLVLRENGQAEVVDFAKFKEFGVSETALPIKHHSGFLGIGGSTENKNPENIQKAIDADKVSQNMQKGMQNLAARRQNGEEGTLYSSAEGGQFKFLLKLDKNNQPDAINYNSYQVDTEKGAITVDQKVDEMREANQGKAVKFSVKTGETHGKSGFLGIGNWQEDNQTTLSLDKSGKVTNAETNRNDHGGSFFGDLLGWVAPIASVIFPPIAPFVAGITGAKNLAEGNILGGITGIAGAFGGAVGNAISKVGSGVQSAINGFQNGDLVGALRSGIGVVGNFSQGAFKTSLDTVGSWIDKGKNFYESSSRLINGEGNLLGNIRGALTGIKDFGGQAVEKAVDGANGFLNRFADVGDSAYNVFNQFSLSNLGKAGRYLFSGDGDRATIDRYTRATESAENLFSETGDRQANLEGLYNNIFRANEAQDKE